MSLNTDMTEQLAIIRQPRFGVDDRGQVSLRFEAYISESHAASQGLSVEDAVQALKDAQTDVNGLEGKPCYVDVGGGMIIYKRMWKK